MRLRELRKKENLTMKEFGKIFNLTESTISLYETGKHEPEFNTLKKFAEFFNVTTDYLLGIENKHNQPTKIAPQLTDEEKQVLSLYNAMDDDTKYTAMTTLEIFAKNSTISKNKINPKN